MSTTAPTTPKPRRRWLQFSLRTLLVLMLVFGCGFGWFAHKVQQARTEREATKAIEKLGGNVQAGRPSGGMLRTAATRVGKSFGEDLSWAARGVHFPPRITDAGLVHLPRLAQLRGLDLGYTHVTDAGLGHLRGLTELQWLDLGNTAISDAGMVHLRALTRLEWLILSSTNVSDAGLEQLKRFTRLQTLSLRATKVTDSGLEHLRGLTQLRELYLNDTQVSDAGLEHLRGLTQLENLNLSNTRVTDAGVDELKKALPDVAISR